MGYENGYEGELRLGANTVSQTRGWTIRRTSTPTPLRSQRETPIVKVYGPADASFEFSCWLDESDTQGQKAMTIGATISVVAYPGGAGSGKAKRAFDAVIESLDEIVPDEGGVEYNGTAGIITAIDETPDP